MSYPQTLPKPLNTALKAIVTIHTDKSKE